MALESVATLFARVIDATSRNPFLWLLVASCRRRQPRQQTAWDKLFERHPEDEVVDIDTTSVVCQALHYLFGLHLEADRRRRMTYFTSFPGSGKSRLCSKIGEFVDLLRNKDPAAAAAMKQHIPQAHDATIGWVARAHVVGVNFNCSRWALSGDDKALSAFGLLVPLYLRIIFFMQADLNDALSTQNWINLCSSCRMLLTVGLVNEASLFKAARDLLQGLAGASSPYEPVVIIVDELHKVERFFSPEVPHAADKYRSAICQLADLVEGHTLFSSLGAHLMLNEHTASGRPVGHLPCLPVLSTRPIFKAALEFNVQRGVYLNYQGILADWVLDDAPPAGQLDLERGVAALSFLVGDDVRFATFLARQLMTGAVGADSVYLSIQRAAMRTAFSHGQLWGQKYGPVVFAHVILERSAPFNWHLTDQNRQLLEVDWDEVRLRGHVQAVGGTVVQPKLPAYALWRFIQTNPAPNEHGIYKGIRQLLTWTDGSLSWHGCESFFQGCILTLDSARALTLPEQECSMAALYPSSTHTGSNAIVTDRVLVAARPRFRVRVTTLSTLIHNFIDGTGPIYDCVWRLNQGATALDAAVFYEHVDGVPEMLCVQVKFSAHDSTTRLSWADSCKWVSAMEAACARQAGARWESVRWRVAYLIAARRRRAPRYEADKAAHPCHFMDKAIVLCWEDLHKCLGSFLFGFLQHAETLFEAEVVQDHTPQH